MSENHAPTPESQGDTQDDIEEIRPTFTYKVVVRGYKSPGEFVTKMNHLGAFGWQIISIDRKDSGSIREVVLTRQTDLQPTG